MPSTNRIISSDGHIPILDDQFAISGTQKCALGLEIRYADGRKFRYAKAGGTGLVASYVQQMPAITAAHDSAIAVAAASAIGTKEIDCTIASVTADEYQDGFIIVEDDAGEGHTYMVKSNTVTGDPTTGRVVFTLYDEIVVALTTATTVSVVPNKYNGVIVAPTTETGSVAGIAPRAVTAAYFCWLQTAGLGAVRNHSTATIIIGNSVARSDGVAGVGIIGTGVLGIIGTGVVIGVNAESTCVDLLIS